MSVKGTSSDSLAQRARGNVKRKQIPEPEQTLRPSRAHLLFASSSSPGSSGLYPRLQGTAGTRAMIMKRSDRW